MQLSTLAAVAPQIIGVGGSEMKIQFPKSGSTNFVRLILHEESILIAFNIRIEDVIII